MIQERVSVWILGCSGVCFGVFLTVFCMVCNRVGARLKHRLRVFFEEWDTLLAEGRVGS